MFDAPTSTLYNSLNNLLDKPKEFLADVCFHFDSFEIWAHRGKNNKHNKRALFNKLLFSHDISPCTKRFY
jgi:hypothetical protein